MKDPTILCPHCRKPSRRIRKLSGVRCATPQCKNEKQCTCTDTQMTLLRDTLERVELIEWAKKCQR